MSERLDSLGIRKLHINIEDNNVHFILLYLIQVSLEFLRCLKSAKSSTSIFLIRKIVEFLFTFVLNTCSKVIYTEYPLFTENTSNTYSFLVSIFDGNVNPKYIS